MPHQRLSLHLQDLIFADFLHALELVRIGAAPDEAFRSHEARVRPLREMVRQIEPGNAAPADLARLEDFVRSGTTGTAAPKRRAPRGASLRLCAS